MKQKIEYQINKHTALIEELINIENSISNVFDGYSEIYKQYKQKFTEACNVKDVTIINQSQESESLEESSDEQNISENFNRQNLKLTLNEDLFDDVVDIIVPDVETDFTVNTIDSKITETPNLGNDTGVSNLIIKAINSEWDTIAEYNELIANLGNNSDMIPVIQDIVAEENTHIGQLQQILLQISPNVQNIEKGEIEGEKQLQETIE